MGFCFSCCGRRKRSKESDEERQPLLGDRNQQQQQRPQTENLKQLARVVGALRVGKLPSQSQITLACHRALRSDFLRTDEANQRGLSKQGRNVLRAVREAVESVAMFGLEKNSDDLVQELLYETRELSRSPLQLQGDFSARVVPQLHTAASAVPSQTEVATDAAALIQSLKSLCFLLLSSSAFRLLLSDFMRTAREIVAEKLVTVEQAAARVENVAAAVEEAVRPEASLVEERKPPPPAQPEVLIDVPRSAKEIALDRIEEIVKRASAQPAYNSALRTILFLMRKYSERVKIAVEAVKDLDEKDQLLDVTLPIVIPDPRFVEAGKKLKILIERVAGGARLDPLAQDFFFLVKSLTVDPDSEESRELLDSAGKWLDMALSDPAWAASRKGRSEAEHMYDSLKRFLDQRTVVSKRLRRLLDDIDTFLENVKSDKSTMRVVNALQSVRDATEGLFTRAASKGVHLAVHWKQELVKTALGWLAPRLLRLIKVLPMPRVEYVNEEPGTNTILAVALDTLILSIEGELFPDKLRITEWSDLIIELDPSAAGVAISAPLPVVDSVDNGEVPEVLSYSSTDEVTRRIVSTHRMRVHIEGIRLGVHDAGYYANYTWRGWLGYEDEGLACLSIGETGHAGQGLSIDVELEIGTDTQADEDQEQNQEKLYKVIDVLADLPGLNVKLSRTRHWMLNGILASAAGPIGRAVTSRILASQLKTFLETLEEKLRGIKKTAEEDKTEYGYWNALLQSLSDSFGSSEEEAPAELHRETETSVNLKGIVMTTHELVETEEDAVGEPDLREQSKSSLAVGLGPQILPGKGEPIQKETTGQAAREVVEDISESVNRACVSAQERTEEVVQLREDVQEAQRIEDRWKTVEVRKDGWRSDAFDL